ncbi:MAG: XdhC family protein [Bacteroidales bacterium]|nr:XdhC family protein [Bacteroidales bacterium]
MKIWKHIVKQLQLGNTLKLLIVIRAEGSSPGRKGFKMTVSNDGSIFGSVGGGIPEIQLVEKIRENFKTEDKSFLHEANGQTIAAYSITQKDLAVIKQIASAKEGYAVFSENGICINSILEDSLKNDFVEAEKWQYVEKIGFTHKLFIFGAGHVSLALSKLCKELGFYITVFDNRTKDLSTYKANRYANKKEIIDFSEAEKFIPDEENIFVLIMTFSHKHDGEILEKMLNKNLKYLGVLGAKKKMDAIYNGFRAKGISEEKFNKVDGPAGISIKSETPAEIAVSIAAKIILVKNEKT